MKWKNILPRARPMNEAEAKAFMNSHKTETYQLIDVRQPVEYQEGHLPGANLVPLNLLMSGGGDLSSEKPTIVYCRSGGRSQAASQWLAGQGFKEVYDIGGHIVSWMGLRVTGPFDLNLDMINPDAEFPDAWSLAFALEDSLQRFYLALEKQETRDQYRPVFRKLAEFEDVHKERLLKGYSINDEVKGDAESFLKEHDGRIEGGMETKSALDVVSEMGDLVDIYGLSMAIEAQSLDFYFRLAAASENQQVKKLFYELADEEKAHLSYLSKKLDAYLA